MAQAPGPAASHSTPRDQQGHLGIAQSRGRVEALQTDLIPDSGLLLHPTRVWTRTVVTLMGDLEVSLGNAGPKILRIEIEIESTTEPMERDRWQGHPATAPSSASEIRSIVNLVVQRGSKVAHTHPPPKPNASPGQIRDRDLVSVQSKAIPNPWDRSRVAAGNLFPSTPELASQYPLPGNHRISASSKHSRHDWVLLLLALHRQERV